MNAHATGGILDLRPIAKSRIESPRLEISEFLGSGCMGREAVRRSKWQHGEGPNIIKGRTNHDEDDSVAQEAVRNGSVRAGGCSGSAGGKSQRIERKKLSERGDRA
jgi:hypothetical protein